MIGVVFGLISGYIDEGDRERLGETAQADPPTPEQAAQHVATQPIGAEPVLRRRQRQGMVQIHFELIVWRDERRGDDGSHHRDEEGGGDHGQRAAKIIAYESEARRPICAVARFELAGVGGCGGGQRTFGLRIVATMSMTTLTTTMMIVK